jgi:hypothetical protein
MTHVDDGRVGSIHEWVQRHRTFADHEALGELRAADQPEMQGERETDRSECKDRQQRPGEDLNRSMPGQPPYLVT